MPTEERKLADIFKAVLSVSGGTLEEFELYGGERPVIAYRFIMDHPVILDRMHAAALGEYLD